MSLYKWKEYVVYYAPSIIVPTASFFVVLLLTNLVYGQVLYGSITGNVTDTSGAAIVGATVTITHKETGNTRASVTAETGGYDFPTVQAGSYSIKITKHGFKTLTRENLTVTLNNLTRVDITIEIGQVSESVTISSDIAQLKTDRADVSSELTNKPLQELPVALGRNYQNLFRTLPGITPPENAHSVPSNPSRSLVFNVNGASRSSNNTRIDGVSTTNVWLPHVAAYVPALEAIETVNIVTNSFDAEQGLAGGAAINVQIKSGTNSIHGSAFEYHSNHKLNAKNFFTPITQAKPNKFIQNQFGGTLGGPVKKDKLFYFFSYEATRNRQLDARTDTSVPNDAIRMGDFSNAKAADGSPVIIYDPLSNPNPKLRTPFPNNKIPIDRIDPVIKKILPLIPHPNLPGETNNHYKPGSFSFDRWTIDSKINWTINSKFNLFGRYSVLDFLTLNDTIFGKELQGRAINSSNPGTGEGKTHNISLGTAYSFSPRFIIDTNFGFVRMKTAVRQSDIKENRGLDFLGIPGTNGIRSFEGGFPFFDIDTYADYGTTDTFMPYIRGDDQYQFVFNANLLRGSHNIRFGSDIYLQQLNHTQPEFLGGGSLGARGGFVFGPRATQQEVPGNSSKPGADQYHSFAAFLLGMPTRIGKLNLTVDEYTTRNRQYSFYVRDQWEINQKLTLSIGTRWEYFPIPTRADRGLERFNLNTGKMEIGGVGSVPMDLGVKISKGLFAPRIGIAWRVNPSFVVRAGYGLTNDPYALARPLRTNHPILINFNQQGATDFLPVLTSISNGIPPVSSPGIGNGVIDVPGGVAVNTLPDDFKRGYVQSWNLTLQKELKWGFTAELGYVATRQIRQLGLLEINWASIGTGRNGRQLYSRYPGVNRSGATLLISPVGNSHYDSLQARLNRRFSSGFQINANYTWSKSIGVAGNDNSDGQPRIKIPEFYHLNRSLSGFDRTHSFTLSNIIELPFGKGKKFLNDRGLLTTILGGWQINNIITLMSGSPFSVTDSNSKLNVDGTSDHRPDLIKPITYLGGIGAGKKYFDTTAFVPVSNRFGTAGWNILRGPGIKTWDFGLFRRFQVTEGIDLQFRAEAFNFTNTPIFSNPEESYASKNFGEISTTNDNAHAPNRQFRFGLRLGF